jgi:hypothetical protein
VRRLERWNDGGDLLIEIRPEQCSLIGKRLHHVYDDEGRPLAKADALTKTAPGEELCIILVRLFRLPHDCLRTSSIV